jgi:hypothetical protein
MLLFRLHDREIGGTKPFHPVSWISQGSRILLQEDSTIRIVLDIAIQYHLS